LLSFRQFPCYDVLLLFPAAPDYPAAPPERS
jgi:hypothetical protein